MSWTLFVQVVILVSLVGAIVDAWLSKIVKGQIYKRAYENPKKPKLPPQWEKPEASR